MSDTRVYEETASLPEGHISIAGLSKAAVLAALYNGSGQLGMGLMHARGRGPSQADGSGSNPDLRAQGRQYPLTDDLGVKQP